MLLEIRRSRPVAVKMRFFKTSKISQESKMESRYNKTVSPQVFNCTKKGTITDVFI